MTFGNLHVNDQVYVLFKEDTLRLEMGTVTNMTPTRPAMHVGNYNLVLDITVKIKDKDYLFRALASTADFAENNDSIIATTKESMNAEINMLRRRSVDALNSADTHKKIIEQCDELLLELNPEIAEQKKQKEDLNALRTQVSEMKECMERLMQQFKK